MDAVRKKKIVNILIKLFGIGCISLVLYGVYTGIKYLIPKKNAYVQFQKKIYSLSHALVENEKLKFENLNLIKNVESIKFNCRSEEGKKRVEEVGIRLNAETKSKVGRTLASIGYNPPNHLLPSQLYTLGVSYFSGAEFEKSAVIFTFLTGLDGNDDYKNPINFLITGIAWYRVQQFQAAKEYFEKVLESKPEGKNLRLHAQARLWQALVAERTQNYKNAQEWLKNLLDYHPKSDEASWINPISAGDSL